ncbi:29361_t:CDS:1, partial [Racocetra persica]
MSRLLFSKFLKESITKLSKDLSKYVKYLFYKYALTAQNQEFSQLIVNELDNS